VRPLYCAPCGAARSSRTERETLYEQVWTEPLRTVAKSYGVSDVHVGRVCRELAALDRQGLLLGT
jgi:hypothetical protein